MENNWLTENTMQQLYCDTCQRFLADRLVEGKCPTEGCNYDSARGDQCEKCSKLLNPTELIDPKCRKAVNNKGYAAGKEPEFESSPVISEPVLVTSHNCEIVPEVGNGENSSLQGEVAVRDVNQDLEKQSTAGSDGSNGPERLREEQVAVKAQVAFRGYLARRAFRALKGIIRLRALIRGHLVRRQAVSTLRATWLIVKFQALVRGRNVRLSSNAIQVSWKLAHQKSGLLASPIVVEALHFQYDERDPNSAFNWLERWTISCVWNTISQPKRGSVTDAKPHTRKASYAMETESGKLKRNTRKSSAIEFC